MNPVYATRWKYGPTLFVTCSNCHQKFSKNAFFDRVVSHFQDKVGTTSATVLSAEHSASGAGGPRHGHHFNTLLLNPLAMPRRICF